MNWAQHAIEALGRGETAQVRPRGHSMKGKVSDGALVTLAPCEPASLKPGDVVLVRVHGSVYLHLVKAVNQGRYLIGNNRGGVNGWVGPHAIYGLATGVE
jgi:SOS-response transcriptional repressor LexA